MNSYNTPILGSQQPKLPARINSVLKSLLVVALIWGALPAWSETIPSGTELTIRLDRDIRPGDKNAKNSNSKNKDSKNSSDSDRFSAALAFPVFANGMEVIPAGSRIEGDIRGTKKAIYLSPRRLILPDGRKLDFNATVTGVDQKRLKAEAKEGTIEGKASKADEIHDIGAMGSEGAIIGALSTYTLEGMAIGAAAGVAAVVIGRKLAGGHDTTVIPAGTQLTLDLNQPLEVPDDASDAKAPEDRSIDRDDRRPILKRADPDTP